MVIAHYSLRPERLARRGWRWTCVGLLAVAFTATSCRVRRDYGSGEQGTASAAPRPAIAPALAPSASAPAASTSARPPKAPAKTQSEEQTLAKAASIAASKAPSSVRDASVDATVAPSAAPNPPDAGPTDAASDAPDAPDAPRGSAVIAHGGVGSSLKDSSVVGAAVHTTLAALATEATLLQAAARGVVVLEDFPGFNAGTGSSLRLDGSLQMDAALMDSDGNYAAVLAVESVKNPVLAALAAAHGSASVFAGEGATAFARAHGHRAFEVLTPAAEERKRRALALIAGSADADAPDFRLLDLALRKSRADAPEAPDGGAATETKAPEVASSTANPGFVEAPGAVAVLVRGPDGDFAGAVSSGGPVLSLRGRLGPLAIRGAALFVGPDGAVAVSGDTETVRQKELARAVYERMKLVFSAKAAIDWGLAQIEPTEPVGISALNKVNAHSAANRPMAWAKWSSTGLHTGEPKTP